MLLSLLVHVTQTDRFMAKDQCGGLVHQLANTKRKDKRKSQKKKKTRREEKYEVKQNIKMWVIPMTGTLKGLGVTTRGGLHFYEVVRSKRGHEP